MSLLILLLVAYFLISLSALFDKFLLTKAVTHPAAYAVLISTIGLTAILFIPVGYFLPEHAFFVPESFALGINILSGASYTLAVYFLYKALLKNDASRVFPFVGALTAIGTFLLSYFFLGERLELQRISAFFVLLLGGLLVSINLNKHNFSSLFSKGFGSATFAGLIFAISYTAAKFTYDGQGFVSGFIWIRISAFIACLVFLLFAVNRKAVSQMLNSPSGIKKRSTQLVLLFGQISTGVGFLLMNYAISIASASIVLAAQGLQYAYLLLMVILLSKKFPSILTEKLTFSALLQKVIAVILISIGLGMLVL